MTQPREGTISARILERARKGDPSPAIAKEVGVSPQYVGAILSQLRRRGVQGVPQFAPTPPRFAPRGRELAARARNITVSRLTQRIPEEIDKDPDPARAILDDGVTHDAYPEKRT